MNDHVDTLRRMRESRYYATPDEQAALDAAIAALEAGRSGEAVLVPREPTPKMIDATWNDPAEGANGGGIESHNTRNRRIYAAMLAAAPQQPPPDPEAVIRDDTRFWLVPDPDKDEKVELTLGLFISDSNKSDAYLQYAAQGQQPPPVGDEAADYARRINMALHWLDRCEIGLSDLDDVREALNTPFAGQQPAPSVSEGKCKTCRGAGVIDTGGYCYGGAQVPCPDCAPVSEPAASGEGYDRELIARMLEMEPGTYTSEAITEQIRLLREADNAHESRAVNRAASGEGLLLDIQRFAAQAKKPGDLPWALIEGEVGDWLTQHGDELIRRLTTTGDVERLVDDVYAVASFLVGGNEVAETAASRLREILAPFGQQQEGQG